MFPSWWRENSNLVVIDLGIDESKIAGKKLLVLAAIIGQTSVMAKLAKQWDLDLRNFGVDYFHAKEHWNLHAKPYHGISQTKRKDLLDRLIGHIHKYANVGLAVAIEESDYTSLTTPAFRSTWGAPYSFAIQLMLPLLHVQLKRIDRLHEPANILIEDGHKNARQIYEILKKGIGREDGFIKLATAGFGGKARNPILQAADLWAYAACQYLTTGESQTYRRLVGQTKNKFIYLNCNAKIIGEITSHIETNLERLKEARVQNRLNREMIGQYDEEA